MFNLHVIVGNEIHTRRFFIWGTERYGEVKKKERF